MSRDNWKRLVVAVQKREQFLQLCYKESTSPSICSISSDFTEEIINHNSESISASPLKITEVSQVTVSNSTSSRSITRKLLSVWHGRSKARDEYSVDLPDELAIHLGRVRRFSLHELRVATENFNDGNIIQEAHNKVYRGWLADGSTVAVKRFKYRGSQKTRFQNEVVSNSITAHPNVVGYCVAPKERLLVYRLINGSPSSGLRVQLEEALSFGGQLGTDNFSEDLIKIGRGSLGSSVYHATLDDGRRVAIKREEVSAPPSYKNIKFLNELEFLSRVNHDNLVRLLGYRVDDNERVLVYDYMENGTLFDHLHNSNLESSPLMSWPKRIKVALDAARGIEYFHKHAVPRVIRRDITSSSILLDATWTAKVSKIGVSVVGPQENIDPEYYQLQLLTTKVDVCSFGVVLLELFSGCKAIHKNENGVPRTVVDYVVPYIIHDEIHRVLDGRVPPPTRFEITAVTYIGYLATDCVMLDGRDRPSMSEVANSLDRALAACSEF